MKKVAFVLLILLCAVSAIAVVNETTKEEVKDQAVYEVCQRSRTNADINERGCADLQDAFGRTYNCEETGMSRSIYCWTERGLRNE